MIIRWMDIWMDGCMHACMHACMGGCMHACILWMTVVICYRLGLEKLYRITRQKQYTLRVDVLRWDNRTYHADHPVFYIDDEEAKYAIHYEGYTGRAEDRLTWHQGTGFSTLDQDNDNDARTHHAQIKAPWWLPVSDYMNLNLPYARADSWHPIMAVRETTMRIRPTFGDELYWADWFFLCHIADVVCGIFRGTI